MANNVMMEIRVMVMGAHNTAKLNQVMVAFNKPNHMIYVLNVLKIVLSVKVQQFAMFVILDFTNFRIYAFQVAHLGITILQILAVLVRLVVHYALKVSAMFANIIIFCKENYVIKYVLMAIILKPSQMEINVHHVLPLVQNVHRHNAFNALTHTILKKVFANHVVWVSNA